MLTIASTCRAPIPPMIHCAFFPTDFSNSIITSKRTDSPASSPIHSASSTTLLLLSNETVPALHCQGVPRRRDFVIKSLHTPLCSSLRVSVCADTPDKGFPAAVELYLLYAMAFKRGSRIHANQTPSTDEGHQSQMASAYLSRRSSWNSVHDDLIEATQDREENQRNDIINWESQPTTSQSHGLVSDDKDTSPSASSRHSENSGMSRLQPFLFTAES